MKLALLSASPRQGSNSLKVATYLASLAKAEGADVLAVLDFHQSDIPLVGRGSLDSAQLSPFQHELVEAWGAAEVVIFVVPEYNWAVPGEFLNALDQLGNKSFASLFDGKVFATVGVSSGRGGRIPCLDTTTKVNKLISFLNQVSIVSPKLFESHESCTNLTPAGESTGNAVYEKGAADFIRYTLQLARRVGFSEKG
jgi:chromate reductase